MQDFTLFLLKNWLPVGIASIAFFLIGLLVAKFIWGRWSQRLAFAVEENLNLASQWNALGSSQRDLFKKLRARWQADRDVWESRLVETESIVAQKDARITQLTGELNASGKSVPAEVQLDAGLLAEIESLKSEIRLQEEANRKLQEEVAAPPQPVPLIAQAKADEESSDLQTRITDLEKDLIDTHDELHQVRADYMKQVELVEVLESRLEEGTSVEAPTASPRKVEQLSALLGQRSDDLVNFRSEIKALRERNSELQAELVEAQKSEELVNELEKAQVSLKSTEMKLADRDSDIARLRLDVEAKEAEAEKLTDEISAAAAKIAEAEILERRRVSLQADLNDSSHEMYDVRRALNERLDEIEMLEARLDELEPIEAAHEAMTQELKDSRHELSDVRLAYNEKIVELETQKAEMEELEAIIEDRGAEVSDLSDEVRQKRDELRLLKNTLAETEGELEAITEEAKSFTATLGGKEAFLKEQALRISDLESALTERYTELNSVRSEFDGENKTARYHESRADQLEAELQRREKQFEESDARVATAEEAVETAKIQIQELSDRLAESEKSMEDLQSSLVTLSREKDETLRELEMATKRVTELEEATREREEHITSIEQEWREGTQHAETLERQIGKLNVEMDQARDNREHTQVAIEELEEALKSSDDRVLELSSDLEKKSTELYDVKAELAELRLHADGGSETADEISQLERKVEKRGEAIRDLQNEVSNIMMQRTARDNEVAALKDKLREVERELSKARELSSSSSGGSSATPPSIRDLEAALQQSLADEASKSEGKSLDHLDRTDKPIEAARNVKTEAHHASSEPEDDDHVAYFDESSVTLSEKSVEKIDAFARQIRRSNKVAVSVIGFAGAEGTADLTESLSARRADAVRERLLERGVPQSKIEVKSSGQDRKFTNWRARRVELVAVPVAVAEAVN